MTTDAARPHRRRPGPAATVLIAAGALVVVWAPSLVGTRYAERPTATEFMANPAFGWAFLWEAVTASRNPRLGTADAAMQQASQVWAGPPAVASDVTLRSLGSEWTVPVPAGGAQPVPSRRTASPDDDLNWVVSGRVKGGPEQVIGVLDYRTGRVEWDIRPVAGARR